ncbi:transglutaminase domain-containing protein [Paenibacillus sp. LHD-117]|uniref:transglutaminase domain-containing protein n=1 Tax=Paenibacillus sp. LHD-117 TaxID=3071412 RepID=UPI0027DEBAE9|nr:transglutaminase domain-containing protein [Paenibacillus sp. LHD-117]MDQ6420281.1 transglutaminase domain-containing protein [Paenibacillus sp. LHD-117]
MTMQTSVFSLDQQAMELIERKFRKKQLIAEARADEQLFGVFRQELTEEETWALKFLFAYMPVNDLADYDGHLFLSHVRRTLEIRRQMPWGERVPDHLFLHFVLPYRVNTENIEDSRGILYNELADRTKRLSMADAILETNYWCHEKAAYIGSDLRTISPLTMIRNARGRCGEESTLAVAALRSIGIPARQVYTPRWAHCDDNHAWVEAWADGEWFYIGACEPEPRLNQGWFSPPARRAMLINTRIFANYEGPEDITLADEWFTEINLLEGYAPTRMITVLVKDGQGRPVSGSDVYFELYNMAEMYPIAILKANALGEASFKTGFGELLIRAVKDGRWGEDKIGTARGGRFELVLDRTQQPDGTTDFDMVPPPERSGEAAEPLSEEKLLCHDSRLEEGTTIRSSYERTFMDEEEALELAGAAGIPPERVWEVLRKARGNSREIAAFLRERSSEYGEWPLLLLESLNEKDLVDTFRPALDDHLTGALSLRGVGELPQEIFIRYVLCPRILYEMIVPYRRLFQDHFTTAESAMFREDPSALVRKLDEEWELWEDLPNLKGKGNPAGTFKFKKGDRISLDILFVAICRSLGIPARLHPSEQKPQFMSNGSWRDALFAQGTKPLQAAKKENGLLRLLRDSEASAEAQAASYFENFTFARLENGIYKTLFYPYGKTDVYDEPFEVEPGSYRLTTGIRLKDGTVRARFVYFAVRAGEQTDIPLTFREAMLDRPVLGTMDRSQALAMLDGAAKTMGELIGNSGAIIAWIEPEREPTKHLIRELGELADDFAELGAPIVLVVGDSERDASFDPSRYPQLPPCAQFVRDSSYAALPGFISQPPASEAGFPHLFVLDGQDQIRYAASGYKIGTGKEAYRLLTGLCRQSTERSDKQ